MFVVVCQYVVYQCVGQQVEDFGVEDLVYLYFIQCKGLCYVDGGDFCCLQIQFFYQGYYKIEFDGDYQV